jgi:hypothetical protein
MSNGKSIAQSICYPTHFLGSHESIAMCLLFVFFGFVCKYAYFGTIVLGFGGD